MECKCGFKGLTELGNFPNDRYLSPQGLHFRCPQCKTNRDIRRLDSIDSVREALMFPEGKSVSFVTGGADKTSVGYSITSRGWGSVGTISVEEYWALTKEFEGKLSILRNTIDCDAGLRKMGIDPKSLDDLFKE